MLSIGQNYVLNLIHCMCPFFMLFEENPKELTNAALNEGGKATSPPQLPNLILRVHVPRGLRNLPQTVFWEGSSIYNRQFLLKTGLILLFKHGNIHYLYIHCLLVSNTVSNKQILIFILCP